MLYRLHSELALQSELVPVMPPIAAVCWKKTCSCVLQHTDFSEQTTYLSIGDSNITA